MSRRLWNTLMVIYVPCAAGFQAYHLIFRHLPIWDAVLTVFACLTLGALLALAASSLIEMGTVTEGAKK